MLVRLTIITAVLGSRVDQQSRARTELSPCQADFGRVLYY